MRKNPFTVRGRIERCWLFSHRTEEQAAREILPKPLEPVTRDAFAFWNIVVCRMAAMRPALLPPWLGFGYWHVAYRLHARVRLADGRDIEGLYFVRSDCDRRLVAIAGNVLTDFRFGAAHIDIDESDSTITGRIAAPGADARFVIERDRAPQFAAGSPFVDLAEAAAFLKYKPCAISLAGPGAMNLVRVSRDEGAWRSRIVSAAEQEWEFLGGHATVPELCTEVAPFDYQWNRAEIAAVAP